MTITFTPGTLPVAPTPLPNTCFGFYTDPAFTNRAVLFPTYLNSSGICTLSQPNVTYFTDIQVVTDQRQPSTRTVNFPVAGAGSLVLDGNVEATNLNTLNSGPSDLQSAIFSLIDTVLFSQPGTSIPIATMDTNLQNDKLIGKYYTKGTLKLPQTMTSGQYYDQSNNPQPYSTWGYVTFTFAIPLAGNTVTVNFNIFIDNKLWASQYPYSEVLAIVPPMDWTPLINNDLTQSTNTVVASAEDIMDRAVAMSNPQLSQMAATGSLVYHYTAVGPNNAWNVLTPFGVLYKGQKPSTQQINAALRTEMANSGVGNQASWTSRFPGVFASGRFYLVPMWDQTVVTNGVQTYTDMINTQTALTKAGNVFSSLSTSQIQADGTIFTSPYNFIPVVAFRDPENDPSANVPSISAVHPTYQPAARDNYVFQQMTAATQQFSSTLIDVLSQLSGQTPADGSVYQSVTELGIMSIVFVVGTYEYCVVSPSSYNLAQGVYQ